MTFDHHDAGTKELQALIEDAAQSGEIMSQNVSGAAARAAQIKGDGNVVGQR